MKKFTKKQILQIAIKRANMPHPMMKLVTERVRDRFVAMVKANCQQPPSAVP